MSGSAEKRAKSGPHVSTNDTRRVFTLANQSAAVELEKKGKSHTFRWRSETGTVSPNIPTWGAGEYQYTLLYKRAPEDHGEYYNKSWRLCHNKEKWLLTRGESASEKGHEGKVSWAVNDYGGATRGSSLLSVVSDSEQTVQVRILEMVVIVERVV